MFRILAFSLTFLIVFGLVFSLGVIVGKKFIPSDEPALVEEGGGVAEKTLSPPEEEESKIPEAAKSAVSRSETSKEERKAIRGENIAVMINPNHKYTIQVSSFQNKRIADRTVRFYKDRGYPAFTKAYSPSDIITFYRVRIGTFQSRERAREYANQIKEKEKDFKFYITFND